MEDQTKNKQQMRFGVLVLIIALLFFYSLPVSVFFTSELGVPASLICWLQQHLAAILIGSLVYSIVFVALFVLGTHIIKISGYSIDGM